MKTKAIKFLAIILTISISLQIGCIYSVMAEGIPGTSSLGAISIDSNNLYEDMPSTYARGYIPTIKNNVATIILPLRCDVALANNVITAGLQLGDASASPFVYKNYEKQFVLGKYQVNGGKKTVSAYYVKFDLPLSSSRQNGNYPVVISTRGKDAKGNDVMKDFTVYVEIKDAKITEVPSGGDAPAAETKPTSAPLLIVADSYTEPTTVSAGEEFVFNVTFRNTSASKHMQNILIKINCEEQNIQLMEKTNSLYYKNLAAGGSLSVKLKFKAGMAIEEGRYPVVFAVSYDDPQAQTITAECSATIEVSHAVKVELLMPIVPAQSNAGDSLPLSFQLTNLSRGSIYNARVELEVPGLIPASNAFFGSVEGGMDAVTEMNVFVGSKDMNTPNFSGGDKYGMTTGKAIFKYEDSSGQEYREEHDISIEIKAQVISSDAQSSKGKENSSAQFWIWTFVVLALIAGTCTFMYLRQKRAK